MPPKTQRGRACTQCRDRRVKCDESPGFCQRCTRLGLQCSGPVTLSIIDMTDKVTRPRQRKKKEIGGRNVTGGTSKQSDIRHQSTSDTDLPTRIKHENGSELSNFPTKHDSMRPNRPHIDSAVVKHRKLSETYQPSTAPIYDQGFVNHFVTRNAGIRSASTETSWVSLLPGLHGEARNRALKFSIRAASMAFYAKLHASDTILADSRRWYGTSLASQRQAVERFAGGKTVPTPEECWTPIILSLYEVYAGTKDSGSSVFQHLKAGTQILAMRGPHCISGLTFPIFVGMRVSDAHRALVFNEPSVFSAPEWITTPFTNHIKNAHMYLIDIVLAIPACLRLSGVDCHLKDFFSTPFPKCNHTTLDLIRERTTQLLFDLQTWAKRNPHLCTNAPTPQVTLEDMTTVVISPATATVSSSAIKLPDTFVALASSTFKSACLVLTLLYHKISQHTTSSLPSPVSPSMLAHAKEDEYPAVIADEILGLSAYIEATHPVGFNFLRSVYPLVIVAMLAPLEKQRHLARQTLDRWGDSRGLGGLCGAWGV